ncbi:MAG: hypothetical protein LBR76_06970, partial [Oscillospiraceae bacterium]|nr:hypothetical protein [Oscillospiraceae bacterium]
MTEVLKIARPFAWRTGEAPMCRRIGRGVTSEAGNYQHSDQRQYIIAGEIFQLRKCEGQCQVNVGKAARGRKTHGARLKRVRKREMSLSHCFSGAV